MTQSESLKKYLDLESKYLASGSDGSSIYLDQMDDIWYYDLTSTDRTWLNSRTARYRDGSWRMELKIKNILILRGKTTSDRILLNTHLAPAVYPFTESPSLSFQVMSGLAEKYCDYHFPGVPYEVQETDSGI